MPSPISNLKSPIPQSPIPRLFRRLLPTVELAHRLERLDDARCYNHWSLHLAWSPSCRFGAAVRLNWRTRATPADVANTWPLARQQHFETAIRAAIEADDFAAFARAYRRAASRGMVAPQSKPQLRATFYQLIGLQGHNPKET